MNPNDVFPRRNLPGESEEWGREVEDRIREVEYAALTQKQDISGTNRTSASSLQELSRQLVQLRNLYRAIPKPVQVSATNAGFGIYSGWTTVVSASLVVPADVNRGSVIATGSGLFVTGSSTVLYESRSRLVISGEAGAEIPNAWYAGNGDFRSIAVPTTSKTVVVTPGEVISVEFQVLPVDASAYPPNASTYAVLSLIGTFTG